MQQSNMAEAVLKLHEIARMLEVEIGQGQLSEDIRNCADRLNVLTKPFMVSQEK